MSFKTGQKVVCINDVFESAAPYFYEIFHHLPKKDQTYTIRLYESGRVLLKEVVNPECPFDIVGLEIWDEPGFDSGRFRDLEELMKEMDNEVAEVCGKEEAIHV